VRQLRGRRRAGAAQARLFRPGGHRLVHAVEPQHVKVDIQVERAAEALDQRHRAALRDGAVNARLSRQPSCDHAMHDAQHRADGVGLAGEQEAQGIGNTQHPLPQRARAEHLFRQVKRTLGHAPRAAARAKPALLAGKGQQPLLRASCPTPFGPAYGCSNSLQTNLSAWHCSHTTRKKPFSSTPQRRNASNSSRTYPGSERSCAARRAMKSG